MRIVDLSQCGEDAELLCGFGAHDLAYDYFCKGLYNSVYFSSYFFLFLLLKVSSCPLRRCDW